MKSIVTSGFLGDLEATTICRGEVRLSMRDDSENSDRKLENAKTSSSFVVAVRGLLREETGTGAFSVAIDIVSSGATPTSGIGAVVVWTNLLLAAAMIFL